MDEWFHNLPSKALAVGLYLGHSGTGLHLQKDSSHAPTHIPCRLLNYFQFGLPDFEQLGIFGSRLLGRLLIFPGVTGKPGGVVSLIFVELDRYHSLEVSSSILAVTGWNLNPSCSD